MIVVAIIAILAAIAISQYQDYVIRAQVSEGRRWPTASRRRSPSTTKLWPLRRPATTPSGLAKPASITGEYVSQVDAANGVIDARIRRHRTGQPCQDAADPDVLADLHAGSIEWDCNRSNTLERKVRARRSAATESLIPDSPRRRDAGFRYDAVLRRRRGPFHEASHDPSLVPIAGPPGPGWPSPASCCIAWAAPTGPAWSGGFLFDDFVNLPALGSYRPGRRLRRPSGATSPPGIADPTGRPLSLLSFLIDARDWPADPRPSCAPTSCCTCSMARCCSCCCACLGRALARRCARADGAALLGAGLWLLHPLFVSTTLYVVQREAMLPATFILLGLLAWLHGRAACSPASGSRTAVDGGVSRRHACSPCVQGERCPAAVAGLGARGDRDPARRRCDPNAARAASSAHRAARSCRACCCSPGCSRSCRHMHDDLACARRGPSRSACSPSRACCSTTCSCWPCRACCRPACTTMPTSFRRAWRRRHRRWLAHAVRARPARRGIRVAPPRAGVRGARCCSSSPGTCSNPTVIPLELYFEHRNYLPAMLLFWPLGRALCAGTIPAGCARIALVVLLFGGSQRSPGSARRCGRRQDEMAALWARTNPASSRAQATAAIFEMRGGRPDRALARLRPLSERDPARPATRGELRRRRCAVRGLDAPTSVDARRLRPAQRDRRRRVGPRWLDRALAHRRARGAAGAWTSTRSTPGSPPRARTRASRRLRRASRSCTRSPASSRSTRGNPTRRSSNSTARSLHGRRRRPRCSRLRCSPPPAATRRRATTLITSSAAKPQRVPHLARATGAMALPARSGAAQAAYWPSELAHPAHQARRRTAPATAPTQCR